MFLLMANFAEKSGIIAALFELWDRLTARITGGLAYAVVGASSLMGALSGDSLGTTGAMAKMAVPQMITKGYSKQISLGVVASAGTIAIMIPPSLALVIFGILTETSIAALLLAGILPGILTAVAYACALLVIGRMGKHLPKAATKDFSWQRTRTALAPTWPFLVVVAAVVGSMYGGFATASEAAALGAVATLLLWLYLSSRRPRQGTRISLTQFRDAVGEAVGTTAMIMLLVIGATLLGYYLTVTGATRAVGDFLLDLRAPAIIVLLLITALYLVLGMFLSQITTLILTLPVIMPVIYQLEYSPIWFGVIATKMVEIGLLSPPVGLNCYVAASATGLRVGDAFKGTRPFLVAEVFVIALLITFPQIALFIPQSAGLLTNTK